MHPATFCLAFGVLGQAATAQCPCCGHALSTTFWLTVGFLGQAIFTARFLVQWIASERKRDSIVPVAFWWFSMAGGMTLLLYAISRRDPVIIVGQSMGIFIYVRNLMLFDKGRRRAIRHRERAEAAQKGIHRKDAQTQESEIAITE